MSSLTELADFWQQQAEVFSQTLTDETAAKAGAEYQAMPRERLLTSIRYGVDVWIEMLRSNDTTTMISRARSIGAQRVVTQVLVDQVMRTSDLFREAVWRLLRQFFADKPWDIDLVEQLETWLHQQRNAVISAYGQGLEQLATQLESRERDLAGQSALIRDLSTPIVPIYEGVLVLPLVGSLNTQRSNQIIEVALEEIVRRQADVLIIDITGVPVVDTAVAGSLLTMARAVRLLGAQVMLVGISSEIARTIVTLGLDLGDVITRANLQDGIASALRMHGLAITAAQPDTEALQLPQ